MPRCFTCKQEFKTYRSVRQHGRKSTRCSKRWNRSAKQSEDNTDDDAAFTFDWDMSPFEGDEELPLPPAPSAGPSEPRRHVTVEEVEDAETDGRFVQPYPGEVGTPLGRGETKFEALRKAHAKSDLPPWTPFKDEEEWELAEFMMRNLTKTGIEEYTHLSAVRNRIKPSFTSAHTFLREVDKLRKGPEWTYEPLHVVGDLRDEDGKPLTEDLELWLRNPVDCVAELIGNPVFKDHISYAPEKVFADRLGRIRRYDEMWTGDWWWDVQSKIPSGGVVSPLILATDKTNLSRFSGDKVVYPVYLTIGNLSKGIRRKPSSHGTLLIGYMPVSKLTCFGDPKTPKYQLFHSCMRKILEPLMHAGKAGVEMVCADGIKRRIFPILAAYCADHQDQTLVASCKENRCPICLVDRNSHGEGQISTLRSQSSTEQVLRDQQDGKEPAEFTEWGLREVFSLFWAGMPHSDIFTCITPDILHQLYKGVFKDHLVKWCIEIMGEKALDDRFKAMTDFPGLRHFKSGISKVSQWTGKEHREMSPVFSSILAGAVDPGVLTASRAILDFIYYARYQSHTTTTLTRMQDALNVFHSTKDVFVELGVCEHFNIPKVHSMLHYPDAIKRLGSADGYNTESSERLHIDYAKRAYDATNHRDYTIQMTAWLHRQEAMAIRKSYISWYKNAPDLSDTEANTESDASDAEYEESSDQVTSCRRYIIPKAPSLHAVSTLSLSNLYGATDFVNALNIFITGNLPRSSTPSNRLDRFKLYKAITVLLQATPHAAETKYRIWAAPGHLNGPRKPPTPPWFDTVLVTDTGRSKSSTGLDGLRIARVRVIFELPRHLGTFPHPLAYVHWYRPLTAYDPMTGMYQISPSTRHTLPNSEVISIDQIVQGCLLTPHFGSDRVPLSWTRGDVLDLASKHNFDKYLDLHTFQRYEEQVHGHP